MAENRAADKAPGGTGKPSFAAVRTAFASLSSRNFRYLWFGQVGAALSMHADMLARSWLTWELTNSNVAVGAVNVARSLPMLLFGLGGGVIADRFDRRKLLIIIQAWTLAMHCIMAALILSGVVQLWHVYVLSFMVGIGQAMNQPIRTSVIPDLVQRDQMVNAIALNSIAINSTRFIGPAIIGVVIERLGLGYAYVWAAVFYVFVIWSTLQINANFSSVRSARRSIAGQFLEGLEYIRRHRLILSLVLISLGPLAFGLAHRTLLPGLVAERLGGSVELLGYLQSVAAVGSIAGAIVLGSRASFRHKGLIMIVMTATYGLSLTLLGVNFPLAVVFILMVFSGGSQTLFRTANTAVLLEETPDRFRGRVLSVTTIGNSLAPFAGLIAGLVADQAGIGAGFLLLGLACFAVMGLSILFYPKLIRT